MKEEYTIAKRGFTLVEIMIVVAIIGILAMLAIPSFANARSNSRRSICRRHQAIIFEQLNIYCMNNVVELTPANFPNLCATRDVLAPDGGILYVRGWNIFDCPVVDGQNQHDYAYIWDNGDLVGIRCNNGSGEVRNLHNQP